MLALEIPLGPGVPTAPLAASQDRIEGHLAACGAGERARYAVRLVLDELAANLRMHGRFAGPPPPLRVEVSAGPEGVSLAIEDAAEPFDPRTAPLPAPPSLDSDREGGLGLKLVRSMAEIRAYRRLPDGRNRTELVITAA